MMNVTMEECSPSAVRASDVPIEDVGPGIKRQMLGYGPGIMICRVWFEKDAVGDVHSHFHSQSSYVESGRFKVHVDGEDFELGAGDSFYVAPHQDHGAVCLEAGVLLDTFSPAREDFLSAGDPS